MGVAIFERTPLGVTTATVDVRHGRSVEDVADSVRAKMVGQALMDWWENAARHWSMSFALSGIGRMPTVLHLRESLLRSLSAGRRLSCSARWLSVRDGVGVVRPDADPGAIGRDLLAWWAEGGGAHRCEVRGAQRSAVIDLRACLNQSMANWERERRGRGR